MSRYCLDTSGLSNPWETLPEDIYGSLWQKVYDQISNGIFCCNTEIFNEIESITGTLGDCLRSPGALPVYEIDDENWDWRAYLENFEHLKGKYYSIISEYNGNRKNTIGLNDLSIITLAQTIGLPVLSMERPTSNGAGSDIRKRIPDVCLIEEVQHLDFNQFLRAEGIRS